MPLIEVKFAISGHLDTAIEEIGARGSFVTQRQLKVLLSRICHAGPKQQKSEPVRSAVLEWFKGAFHPQESLG